MPDDHQPPIQTASPAVAPEVPSPSSERFRELAELEQEISRRLRSNQRFLERFLDEDFIDDEADEDEDQDDSGAEEV
jgi:hypothetical protein